MTDIDVKVCRICLRANAKMYHYDQFQLKLYYEEVLGLKVESADKLLRYFCYECAAILHRFHKFKEKCYTGLKLLKRLIWTGPITYESIQNLDTKDMPMCSLQIITDNYQIPTATANRETIFLKDEDRKADFTDINIIESVKGHCEPQDMKDVDFDTDESSISVYKSKTRDVKRNKRFSELGGGLKVDGLDRKFWKVSLLSEEEALDAFRARAEDAKYLAAAFKCTDCFRGFSKQEMLERHRRFRHDESVGHLVCEFCRMRYKMDCHLKKHKRRHYHKYECLRCDLVCPLEQTALVHEEYHSGVKRKCAYCNQEFRHVSTYYSHLRTHRSEHVCVRCGASFVSALGLRQHVHLKHAFDQIDSTDDEDSVGKHCSLCNIRFGTLRAYNEHLLHSAMHDIVESDDEASEAIADSKKMPGRKQKVKITKGGGKRNLREMSVTKSTGRKRKMGTKRAPVKPMTCYQCGQHFDTQKACWLHHIAEHPRTSFFPPNQRHICEICGASLAPGSVKMHRNIHTREKVHNCETCGRQFHSAISLTRHLVTHTGEKPYACPLCDKRFTQNNSMKLHYRTFHLKQPYPKRNRSKSHRKHASNSDADSEENSLEKPKQPGFEPETAQIAQRHDNVYSILT